MAKRYQSPPTWPAPPPGWTPPPGWEPDPSWGPPPPGWQFWVVERPNRRAFAWALLASLGWWVLLVVVLSLAVDGFTPEAAGALLASFLVGGLVAALAVRWISVGIPVWVYPFLVLPFVVFFRFLSVLGQTTP